MVVVGNGILLECLRRYERRGSAVLLCVCVVFSELSCIRAFSLFVHSSLGSCIHVRVSYRVIQYMHLNIIIDAFRTHLLTVTSTQNC